jgi:hypothetical protein
VNDHHSRFPEFSNYQCVGDNDGDVYETKKEEDEIAKEMEQISSRHVLQQGGPKCYKNQAVELQGRVSEATKYVTAKNGQQGEQLCTF